MKLEVREATPAAFEAAKHIYGPETGDLVGPAVGAAWPLVDPSDLKAAKLRAEWSCQRQKELLEHDPTAHLIKVVDTDQNDELVALGQWHRYPTGYQRMDDLEHVGLKDRNDPTTWPEGLHKDFYIGLLDSILEGRTSWMGTGHYWGLRAHSHHPLHLTDNFDQVLTSVKTREPLQKNGAGSLILQWGLAQAAKEGVPAYLESVVQAMHLYETHGFRDVGRFRVDCTPYGMPGIFEIARMRADPK